MKARIESEVKIFGINFFIVSAAFTVAIIVLSIIAGNLLDFYPGVLLVEVHHAPEAAAGLDAGELVVVVLKERIAGIGHAVGRVDFAGLECHGQRVTVGNGADGDLVDLHIAVPVVDVLDEIHMVVRDDFGRHIGTGADDAAVVGDANLCLIRSILQNICSSSGRR